MRSILFATFVAATLPLAASAQNFKSVNKLTVIPLGQSAFEVIQSRGEGPRGLWCAGAEFAKKRLGARGRIYILKANAPSQRVSGRKSVIFTTDAGRLPNGPRQSHSLTTSQTGIGLPVNHAIQFCRKDEFELSERKLRRN
ncbi:hypothetical protein DSW25_09685 [Sulfitobacter donghicola DSW-25 = KCTC 12864 = JCM 14565]|uniref:Uncharacterized protein n=1 Tax=Sulfitobacter donghicola DSW-25 = KCTC 12864 = JCM 14565 TaxID=1300350 RepID=A0A073IHM1_9RHOB|nr:hypothetical protein DSW25_09685 [Sulfitobacter donghicola DSW-25 = KCTC 12864 = JCM 14565]